MDPRQTVILYVSVMNRIVRALLTLSSMIFAVVLGFVSLVGAQSAEPIPPDVAAQCLLARVDAVYSQEAKSAQVQGTGLPPAETLGGRL